MTLSFTTMAVDQTTADAYAVARGVTDWVDATIGKTEALRRGQDYVAGRYNWRWAVEFDDATAPSAVKYAIIEAAMRELAVPFCLTPDLIMGREKVLVKADSISWQPVMSAPTSADMVPTVTAIDYMLSQYVTTSYGAVVV